MKSIQNRPGIPIGRFLERLRVEAKLTQEQLAEKVTFKTSAPSISRIEDGEKPVSDDELNSILKAIGTPKAQEFAKFLLEDWDVLERPAFDHPSRKNLWQANVTMRKLARLRENPNLKRVFLRQVDLYEKELTRLADFLRSRNHQIAFMGILAVGKSTGISKLGNLLKPGENKLDKEIVLETGAGGITLCEVHIMQGPRHGLRIEPRTRDSIEKDVEDFAEYLIKVTRPEAASSKQASEEDGDLLGISKEVVRAIRNMADLTEKRKEEAGRKVRVDPAKELASKYSTPTELAIQILSRMALPRRNRRDLWYPEDCTQDPMHWLQQVFAEVNNGRHPEITLPSLIEVTIPEPVFASEELPLKLIDTKGVDQTAEREDLESHFDDPRTLVVLCTRFNDSPDIASQTLLKRAKDAGVRDIESKTILLVLARPDEALEMKYDGGGKVENEDEGYDLKKDQIDLRLNGLGFNRFPVVFFNAKENDPRQVRDILLSQIVACRQEYCEQIVRLVAAVDHLIKHQENETVRLVFEKVSQPLAVWIDNNGRIEWPDLTIQASLVSAIGTSRHASTVRASVARRGDWPNLDYYHHLGFGTRKIAVQMIGEKVNQFKIIVKNLLDDDGLSPAREFLNRVLARLDTAVDDSYRNIQLAGREAFKGELNTDHVFWSECREKRGKGYCSVIGAITDERFQTEYDDAHQLARHVVSEEWSKIITLLDGMLKEQSSEVAAAGQRKQD